MALKKTNAARTLDSLHIPYALQAFTADESDLSADAAARSLGVNPDLVFKTLVVRGDKTGVLLACIPALAELNLKRLASATGNKNVNLVPLKEVQPLTGYIRGGCSPVGTKKVYPVCIHVTANLHPHIYVSAGQRGLQFVIAPDDLARAVNAIFADITHS